VLDAPIAPECQQRSRIAGGRPVQLGTRHLGSIDVLLCARRRGSGGDLGRRR
jgi:hypothetical protein